MTLRLVIHHFNRQAAALARSLLVPRLQAPGRGGAQAPRGQGLLVHRSDR